MSIQLIDSHIHLDMYQETNQAWLLESLRDAHVEMLIAVSNHLESAGVVLEMAASDNRIKPAIGYHPEQILPETSEVQALMALVQAHQDNIVAIGEVGLPYYMRAANPDMDIVPYINLLERFIEQASAVNKPIVLHAVYEDATIACDLLEANGINKAHFHWFKGSDAVLKRILRNGYVISVTPDVVYEPEIQHIVQHVPLEQLMVETDGPWPFAGPFENQLTHPEMMHQSISKIAEIKQLEAMHVYEQIYATTCRFYNLNDLND